MAPLPRPNIMESMFGTSSTPGFAEPVSPAATTDPTNPNPNNATGTDPYSGFSARYQPGALRNVIYDNPWAILPDVFSGMQQNTPGYQNLRDIGADPLTLYNIMQGAFSNMQNMNEGDYANWLAQMYGGLGTVGGRSFNSRELLGAIGRAREGSALRSALDAGDTSTQVRTLYNLASEAMNAGMNPLAARAMQANLAQQGDRYMNSALKTDAGEGANAMSFDQWLAQNAPGLLGR